MIDPAAALAFSLYENKGVYALLLGSGLSRAAQIPTGWEITLDLVERWGRLEGEEGQADWAEWYRDKTGAEPNYSDLLDRLSSTPDERRAILHRYIEPSAEEREEGQKTPTKAHRAVARLVRDGFVRVVITTNFDRLLENAFREEGVEPTVIATADALAGAVPLAHAQCYVVKLHGDYHDTRIRNTEQELADYPEEFKNLLARVFDEYGLIVCGWSADWDHDLRAAILRAPSRRYPMYWAARGAPSTVAQDVIAHRGGKVIPIADADGFFGRLTDQVSLQDEIGRPNPRSVELLVAAAKRYLAKSEDRIRLADLIGHELRRALEQLADPSLRDTGYGLPLSEDDFRRRAGRYKAIAEPLVRPLGVLGRWGDGSEVPLVFETLRALYSTRQDGGLVTLLGLQQYPAVLAVYGYGLGALKAGRYKAVFDLLTAELPNRLDDPHHVVTRLFLSAWDGHRCPWGLLTNVKSRAPLSRHLFEVFAEWVTDYDLAGADTELTVNMFELLGSLAYSALKSSPTDLAETLQPQIYYARTPVGRLTFDDEQRNRLLKQVSEGTLAEKLMDAGFGNGNPEHLKAMVSIIRRVMGHMEFLR